MNLVGTLAKLAVGYAVARGVKSVIGGGGSAKTAGGGSVFGGQAAGGSSSGLEGIMDGLLKGGTGSTGQSTGGLGDILGKLGGATGGTAGGLGGLGGLLTEALQGGQGQTATAPSREEEDAAGLMIRAMLQAAKSDGQVDEAEKQKLLGHLGDLSQDEIAFINTELSRDIDLHGLAADVPRGMEQQVYMMSLMGIDLDNQNEAQYLNDLAQAMRMDKTAVNQIHNMLGVQPLYA